MTRPRAKPQGAASLLGRRGEARAAELEAANARLRYQAHLLASVHDAVLAADDQGRLTAWNRAAEELFGCVAEDVLGRHVGPLLQECGLELSWREVEQAVKGLGRLNRVFRASRAGEELLVEITATRPDSEAFTGYIAVCRDVTLAERSRRALDRYAQRLSLLDEVQRRMLGASSSRQIASLIVEHLRDVIGCDRASLFVYDFDRFAADALAVTGRQDEASGPGLRLPLGGVRIPDGFVRGEPHLVADLTALTDASAEERMLISRGLRSRLSVPLLSQGRLIGALHMSSERVDAFDAEAASIAREAASSFAVALQNLRLLEQVQEGREHLTTLNRRVLQVQEEERRAVARELHDEAGESLTALLVNLGNLEKACWTCPNLDRVQELKQLAGKVLDGLHGLAMSLRPASLDRLGLVGALRGLTENAAGKGFAVDFEAVGVEGALPPELEITLFRVTQEALTNVARHANASRASVLVAAGESRIAVVIEDDGRGFDVAGALRSGTLGLAGMRERVEMAGGRLQVESEPGAGATVHVELPLRPLLAGPPSLTR